MLCRGSRQLSPEIHNLSRLFHLSTSLPNDKIKSLAAHSHLLLSTWKHCYHPAHVLPTRSAASPTTHRPASATHLLAPTQTTAPQDERNANTRERLSCRPGLLVS